MLSPIIWRILITTAYNFAFHIRASALLWLQKSVALYFDDVLHTYYLEFYYNKTQAIPSSSHWSIFIYTTAATSAICYHVIYHQTSYDAIWSNDFRTEGAAPLQKQLWPANEKKTAALSCCTGSNNQVFKYLWSQSNWNSWKSFGCKETLIESRKALNQL